MQKVETKRSTVYLVNESELSGLKKFGRQMRAQCPVHNSRDRDLVLVPFKSDGYLSEEDEQKAGLGHCFSDKCKATVRVIEWNPDAASKLLGHRVKAGVPRYSITNQDEEEANERQQRELSALNRIYDTATAALHHARCLGYLEARGLGSDEALALLERLGAGYIPPSEDWKKTPPRELLKWCDRVIFPHTTRNGERGYMGRTLVLWTPDMDENEHKRVLNEHDEKMEEQYGLDAGQYQIRRWRKTYRSGFFNAGVLGEHRHIIMTEGTFDAIPLMLAGLVNVIAIAGTELDVEWLRSEKKVMDVTLAFDSDTSGKNSTHKTVDRINATGITAHACTPPDDGKGKDWSERYRLAGIDGLAPVLNLFSPKSDENRTGNPDQHAAPITTSCSNHDQAVHVASTPVSPATLPLVTASVTVDPHDDVEINPDQDATLRPMTPYVVEITQHTEPAQLPEHEEYIDPLNFCSVCGGITDEIIEDDAGQLVAYCKGHKPMTRDETIQRLKDALPGWKVELLSPGEEWPPKQVQTPVQTQEETDFWTELARRRAAFDPSKPVDWTRHGYQRGQDGRWHAPNSQYWTDNGYRKGKDRRWYLPEEVSA